jgi:hypothetical protein
MRSRIAATTAIVIAMAATTASAGVLIYQDVVTSDARGEHKSGQTVMIQGNKQKVVTEEREFITDLDAGKTFILMPSKKRAGEMPFPPSGVFAMLMTRQGNFVGFEKASGTNKVAGYDCQNYSGAQLSGHIDVKTTECVASAAAGAREYVAFRTAMMKKIENTKLASSKGEIPDGIPVSSTVTSKLAPFPIPPGFSPEQAAKIKESEAKAKPDVTTTTVTKIEVRDLPPATFTVPDDFKGPEMPPMPTRKGTTPEGAPAAAPMSSPAAH